MLNYRIGRPRVVAAIALAVAIVAALALVYLRSREHAAAPALQVDRLSIALPSLPHPALLHIAAGNGYFAEQGLEVTIVPVTHGKAALELLAQGKVDLATAAEVPFVLQILAGQPFGMVAAVFSASNSNAVVARRDRGIALPGDLVTKRVGVSFGTSGEYFLWAFLIRHKLSPDSVSPVDLAPGQLAQELAKGNLDAIATWQPIVSQAQAALGANAQSFTETRVYTELHIVVGRDELLKARPAAIRKLVRALLKAEAFNRSEPEQALTLVAERLKVDVQDLRPAWKDYDLSVNLLQSQLITMEEQVRWASARGHAAQGLAPNLLTHLYPEALMAVQPDRVTLVR